MLSTRKLSGSRRDFLQAGMYAVGISAGVPAILQQMCYAQAAEANDDKERHPERILVVLELTGGNDGLNTVVPFANDAYYRARPKIAIKERDVLKIEDEFGLHPACEGLRRVYDNGELAIVLGCGYPDPSLSHFTAMEWWHTATPHANDEHGWLGRFADASCPDPVENYIVNVAGQQTRAIASKNHSPVVFKDPKKFGRVGTPAQQRVFERFGRVYPTSNESLDFVNSVSRTATAGAAAVRSACAEYRTLVDYGSDNDLTLDLKKVAAMIAANLPTRIFYVSQGGYDHHASQPGLHQTQLIYLSDALQGFSADLKRIGRSADVAVMVFSEFGRRVEENASQGTDHGTAGPMFVLGHGVSGGMYGEFPSLSTLEEGNLVMTTDFRSVYATVLNGWMGFQLVDQVLGGVHKVLPIFT